MLIRRRRGWELPESACTPEAVVLARRSLLGAAGGLALAGAARAEVPHDAKYDPDRPVTAEKYATTYNNYYEFGSDKDVWENAQALRQRPWTIRIEGMVKTPRSVAVDDLLKQVTIEERIYRHRCVEAWAMTVPWTGFPLAELLRLAEPAASAKFVVLQTAEDPGTMSGLGQSWYPWPYVDGLTMAEAANDLAFIATGLYGKPLPAQNGGPLRLVVPWKYGFKSVKAIVRVSFTDKRPATFWETIQPQEYGFWANVNPDVPHPRWSQASERLLGTNERVPTRLYNGYAAFVASLYPDKSTERLFM